MPYVCEKEYRLIKSKNVKKNLFMAKDEKDACYQILSIGLWWTFVVYKTRLLLAKKFTL